MNMLEIGKGQKLSLFAIVMINVMAVDSLRTLPISAQYGFSLVFFYILASLVFFIPSALAAAELASAWPQTGGPYIWIREALGERLAFVSVWLQWFYNVCWYPTIIALVSATIAYLFDPTWVDSRFYMMSSMILIYVLLTIINCFGLNFSSKFTNFTAIFGTLFPMLLIIGLGFTWLILKKPLAIELSFNSFFPDLSHIKNLVLLTAVLYGLVGIEMSSVHAGDVSEPSKTYPRALLISIIIIFFTLVLSSLSIALVVPKDKLNLITGLLQAFDAFFAAFHMEWCKSIIAVCIVLGSLGSVIAWIIGPAKGLMVACDDGCLPKWLGDRNRYDVPYRLLMIQLVIFIFLSMVFIMLPSVKSAFWLLTDITAQLALIGYILFFASLIRLRYKASTIARPYRIPGGNLGVWMVGLMGISSSLGAVFLGFIPPTEIEVENIVLYELLIGCGLFMGIILPFLLYYLNNKRSLWLSRG